MPALNWETFTGLPGGAEKNFELLCRGIVRQNFGGYGTFRALANQPGVEFHLKLDKRCDALGDPARWWGWQCKWYELAANGRSLAAGLLAFVGACLNGELEALADQGVDRVFRAGEEPPA